MLSRAKTFLTGLVAKSRASVVSVARRLGWVRLHELASAQARTRKLELKLSESRAALVRDRERIDELSRGLAERTRDLVERTRDLAERTQDLAERTQDLAEKSNAAEELKTLLASSRATNRILTDDLAARQIRLDEQKRKSDAFAQQLEVWRARAADYKQSVGQHAEKLGAFREKLARQERQAEEARSRAQALKRRVDELSAGLRDARERERQVIEAMRSRELAAAQNMAMVRASLARMRQGGEQRSLAEEEVALLAEIDRLSANAERQGQTLHRTFDVERVMSELRAGKVALVPFSLDAVLQVAPGQGALLLTADARPEAGLKEIARRHAAELRALASRPAGKDEQFDVVATAFDLETLPDPVAALQTAAGLAKPGGKLVVLGSAWRSQISDASDLWRTPPKMLQSLLPGWTWDRFVLVGPGGKVGLEIVDPALLLEFRPALGKGAPLLAPPYMCFVAVAQKQLSAER